MSIPLQIEVHDSATYHSLWWDSVVRRRWRRGIRPCRERDDDRNQACDRDHRPALELGGGISGFTQLHGFMYRTLWRRMLVIAPLKLLLDENEGPTADAFWPHDAGLRASLVRGPPCHRSDS